MENQVKGYNGIFPKILRELLDAHPRTGDKTTLKVLAEYVGVRQQSVSLYRNGETQPSPETLVKIAEYFDVSVDYLLTGVSSGNTEINKKLGLSEKALNMIELAKGTESIKIINELLSDKDFYTFLEDIIFKSENIQNLTADMLKKYDGLDVENFYIWDLQKFVEEFILRQLKKRGMEIEDRRV